MHYTDIANGVFILNPWGGKKNLSLLIVLGVTGLWTSNLVKIIL